MNIPIREFMDLKEKLAELQARIEFNDEKISFTLNHFKKMIVIL